MIKKIIIFIKSLFRLKTVHFIGSADKLLHRQTHIHRIEYVTLSMEGDLSARSKLIEHNLRLVVFLAKKYENTNTDLEDLVSIGTIGLIKGVNTYKLDKNIKLATYASRCIDNEILMFLRKNKRRNGEVSFEDSLSYDAEGNELHLEDILGTDEDIVTRGLEEELEKKLLYSEIKNLKERDKKIMIMRYGLYGTKEYTQKEVASIMNISQSYISRIEKKIINRLKVKHG